MIQMIIGVNINLLNALFTQKHYFNRHLLTQGTIRHYRFAWVTFDNSKRIEFIYCFDLRFWNVFFAGTAAHWSRVCCAFWHVVSKKLFSNWMSWNQSQPFISFDRSKRIQNWIIIFANNRMLIPTRVIHGVGRFEAGACLFMITR